MHREALIDAVSITQPNRELEGGGAAVLGFPTANCCYTRAVTARMSVAVGSAARPAASVAGSRASSSRSRNTNGPSSSGLRDKTQRGALITSSLPMLQNLIKRAPESYAEEFQVQWARFGSQVKIVQLGLGGAKADEEQLKEVTNFVCQASRFLSLYLREWVPGGARAR
jgi:hypothetical protein